MIHPTPYSGPTFSNLNIGLLGGSFNPAHPGHLEMSLHALRRMDLHQIWWLVTPHNPLKPEAGMAPFAARFKSAEQLARHPRIIVSAIEAELGTRYTVDTLKALQDRFTSTRFVWLMGADNLLQIPKWKRWNEIFARVPIAVFRRPGSVAGCGRGLAAQRYGADWHPAAEAKKLPSMQAPAWIMLDNRLNLLSSTEIRARVRKEE
jgi:nicotinate-nucleotide adenylyltransferase